MQEHYAESITVGELADLCGFSQVHFMNVFKEAIGATCIQYLIEYRLAQAAARLQESDEPVTQIALDTGFQNISYFNRTFKIHYHVTPTAYRRKRA
jgi:AraC-like DNA-binding protein